MLYKCFKYFKMVIHKVNKMIIWVFWVLLKRYHKNRNNEPTYLLK